MSNTMPSDPGAMGSRLVAERAQPCLDWLRQAGELVVGTGCLQSGSTALSLHTDFGPAGQDKETNQDYALAWLGGTSDVEPADRWRIRTISRSIRQRVLNWVGGTRAAEPEPFVVLALADGLTSSYRSEWASELACAVAMQTLVQALTTPPAAQEGGREQALHAFAAAGRRLQEVAQAMEAKPEESCPPGTFLSTWKYILRKGGLLQTTLTLVWLRGGLLRVAMLGDGGVLWRDNRGAPAPVEEVLTNADLSTNTVNALGPRTPEPSALDFWEERPWTGRVVCALYSDGVGRGSQLANLSLLDRVSELQTRGSSNTARDWIHEIVDVEKPDPAFDDNLTLAILRRE